MYFLCTCVGIVMRACVVGRRLHICQIFAQSGDTALILAACYGHTDCARLLLDAGADKDAQTNVRFGRFVVDMEVIESWIVQFVYG
jgi:hypothetical protein